MAGCGRFGFGRSGDETSDAPASGDADGKTGDGALLDCTMTHPSALFCDGFETVTSPPMPPWDYAVIQDAVVQQTTARAYRGAAALESITAATANTKYARWGHFLPAAISSGELYLRSYQWLASTSTITEQVSILVTGNGQSPFPATFAVLAPNEIWLIVNGTQFVFSNAAFPTDRWVCVQLHIHIDATAGTADLRFDSDPPFTSGATNTLVAGGYTQVEAGVHYASSAQTPVTMYVDEFVADTSPIGCN